MTKDFGDDALKGTTFSKSDAANLERRLKTKPNHQTWRAKLLGYYFDHMLCCPQSRRKRVKHIIWMIEHHPDFEWSSGPFVSLDPMDRNGAYDRVRKKWERALELHQNNAAVIGNMAAFFLFWDIDESETLYLRARHLEPDEGRWRMALAQIKKFKQRPQPSYKEMDIDECPPLTCDHVTTAIIEKLLAKAKRSVSPSQKDFEKFRKIVYNIEETYSIALFIDEQSEGNPIVSAKTCKEGLIWALSEFKSKVPQFNELDPPVMQKLWNALVA